MATGETVWSAKDKQARRFVFTPPAPGQYKLKLRTRKEAELGRKKDDPKAVPYISYRLEVLNTAEEGGKNKLIFPRLFLSLKETKNGGVMPESADQLLGLCKALGTVPDFPTIPHTNAAGEKFRILNPHKVLEWLKSVDGQVISGVLKHQKKYNSDDKEAVVSYFEEASEEQEEELDEGEGEQEELGLDAVPETDTEADEDVEEDEPEPEPVVEKPARKTPARKTASGKR